MKFAALVQDSCHKLDKGLRMRLTVCGILTLVGLVIVLAFAAKGGTFYAHPEAASAPPPTSDTSSGPANGTPLNQISEPNYLNSYNTRQYTNHASNNNNAKTVLLPTLDAESLAPNNKLRRLKHRKPNN